jgi:hypothetical protein
MFLSDRSVNFFSGVGWLSGFDPWRIAASLEGI